jgi:hypothetical protein
MAKKRTLAPFYTKAMQSVTQAARRSGKLTLMLTAANEVKHARRMRAFRHLMAHSWPLPLTGTNYAAVDYRLGQLARFS